MEISGIPESIDIKELESTVLALFKKIDVNVASENIESCHRLKPGSVTIVKLSRRKDVHKIIFNKNKLKDVDATTMGLNPKVYINESLSKPYKLLWNRCKGLKKDKIIASFWVFNGSLKVKCLDDTVRTITHHICLDNLIEGNSFL